MKPRALLLMAVLTLMSLLFLDTAAVFARASSGGSRGSRSYSSPATPSSPSSPSQVTTPTPSAPQQQRPGMFGGGLMGGLAGLALGGLIGSMLFGGLGGGFGGGVGLLEMVLIGGAAFLLFRMFRARQQPQPGYAGAGGASAYGAGGQSWPTGGGAATVEAPAGESDLDRGLGHIRGMDPSFDPDRFTDWAKTAFVDVQAAIARRELGGVQDRLTPQEFGRLQAQCDQLRGARRTNKIERVQIGRAQVSEAWQESGQDWVTVCFMVSLVDYVVDDTSGAVVEGSTSPESIEEYWTFTRPVGPKAWRLSAIQTA